MVAENCIVGNDGTLAKAVTNGQMVDSIPVGKILNNDTGSQLPAIVAGTPVMHACQRVVGKVTGATAVLSNNALLVLEDAMRDAPLVNCQSVGLKRIATMYNGQILYEPVTVTPVDGATAVTPMLVPGGFILAGESADARFLVTATY